MFALSYPEFQYKTNEVHASGHTKSLFPRTCDLTSERVRRYLRYLSAFVLTM